MNREQAREYMRTHATNILKPDKHGKGFICQSVVAEKARGVKTPERESLRKTEFISRVGQGVSRTAILLT